MTSVSLHLPRKRKPILTVGRLRLLMLLADIAIWVAIVCVVRHVWG